MGKEKSPGGLEKRSTEKPKEKPKNEHMEEYSQLIRQLSNTPPGKASRELHKKLKKFDAGLEFHRRYPNFSLWLAVAALLLSVLAAIIRFVT